MNSNLKKIIKLIQKTGDRFIVSDSDLNMPYVVMPLEDYERLVLSEEELEIEDLEENTTESQLLEKINHDIAVWKSQQEKISETLDSFRQEEKKEEEQNSPVLEKIPQPEEEKKPEEGVEDQYYFEPLES